MRSYVPNKEVVTEVAAKLSRPATANCDAPTGGELPRARPMAEFCLGCPFSDKADEMLTPDDPRGVFGELVQSGHAVVDELAKLPTLPTVRKGIDVPAGAHRVIAPCYRDYLHDVSSPTDLSRALYTNGVKPSCVGIRMLFERADRDLFEGLMIESLEATAAPKPKKVKRRPARVRRGLKRVPSLLGGTSLFEAFATSE